MTGGSKKAIIDDLKSLFRKAAHVFSEDAQDETPQQRRKRRGETEGEFQRQARLLARPSRARQLIAQFGKRAKRMVRYRRTIRLSPEEWGPPDAHLTDTRALTEQWSNTGGGGDYSQGPSSSPTNTNYVFPRF